MNSNDPVHLGQPGRMPEDCDDADEAVASWRCCRCKKDCSIVEDRDYPAFKNSACCAGPAYRTDMDEPVQYSPAQRMARASRAAAANGDVDCALALLAGAMVERRQEKGVPV